MAMRLFTSPIRTFRSIKTNLEGTQEGGGSIGQPSAAGGPGLLLPLGFLVVATRGHTPATLTPVHGHQAHPCCHPCSCQAGVGVVPCIVVKGEANCACSILGTSGNALGPISGPLPHLAPKAPARAASCPQNPHPAPISLVMVCANA